jgi:hypothetical protein
MNNEKFEEAWAEPTLRALCDAVKNIDAEEDCLAFAEAVIGGNPTLHLDYERAPGFKTSFRPKNFLHIAFTHSERSPGRGRKKKVAFSDARLALYHVYGLFDQIHSRLKSEKFNDEGIKQKISNGELLANDPRF